MTFARMIPALALVLALTADSSAFYFPGWPSATRPPVPTLMQNSAVALPPIVVEPQPPEEVSTTPEPATLTMAGVGLGLYWAAKRRKLI